MFYSAHDEETQRKIATGPIIDYDTARDTLVANDGGTRIYALIERVDSPYIERLHNPVQLSDLAPAIGFAWVGASAIPLS